MIEFIKFIFVAMWFQKIPRETTKIVKKQEFSCIYSFYVTI
jgi:hypothetical protein